METSPISRPSVLFVCVANSCRSQMAEAIARSLVGDRWDVWSAGSSPTGQVHPVALRMMAERGLDLAAHYCKGLDQVPARHWDYVVTMGCGEACPAVVARHHVTWQIPDPVGRFDGEARRIRDQLATMVQELIRRHSEA